MQEPVLRKSLRNLQAGVSPVAPEKFSSAHGRLAISTELNAANSHSSDSLLRRGSVGNNAALRLPR
jgi:hypothetical protein